MKTKTLVAFISGMVIALFAISPLNAQTTPTTGGGWGGSDGGEVVIDPPVFIPNAPESMPFGDLRKWAWERVGGVAGTGWSEMDNPTNNPLTFWVKYEKPRGFVMVNEIFDIVKTQSLSITLVTTNQQYVAYYCRLTDTNGFPSFYDVNYSTVTPPIGGGVISKKVPLKFKMAEFLWVPCGGAVGFTIVEEDENGKPIRFYSSQQIIEGWMRAPAYFGGKTGKVTLIFPGGAEKEYDLKSGKSPIKDAEVLFSVSEVSEIGTRTFVGFGGQAGTNQIIMKLSPEESEQHINPVAQVEWLSDGEAYVMGYRAYRLEKGGQIFWESANSIHVKAVEGSGSFDQTFEIEGGASMIDLKRCVYWIELGWPSGYPNGQNEFPIPTSPK